MTGRGGKASGKVTKSASKSGRGSRQSSLSPSAKEQFQKSQADDHQGPKNRNSPSPETSQTSSEGAGHAQHSSAFTAVNAPAVGNPPAPAQDPVESALLQHALGEAHQDHPQQQQPEQLQQLHQLEQLQDLKQLHDLHQQNPSQASQGAQAQTASASAVEAKDQPTLTGEQAVVAAYGSSIKIDSALCKKLAGEPARRQPVQRRADQKLNMERRSNVEALLAHVTGEEAARACKNCHKGHGPWTTCVVYDGQMCGSCSNCWFNASGSRCTFHENNNPQPPAQYQPQSSPVGPAPPASQQHQFQQQHQQQPHQQAHQHQQQHQQQHHQQHQNAPLMPYQFQFQPAAAQPASAPAPPAPMQPASGNYANSLTLSQLYGSDIAQWRMADAARRAINRGWEGMGTMSRRQRYIARIEAAAKELGMRIAEYDEYMRSPEGVDEGIAEERAAQDVRDAEAQAQAQVQQEQADAS